ncbi:hypothetical protein MAQ5080_00465 [Marinomonas aquimarina]|uniref:Uncharacterized protein n=1 Tax=Marinomonas aquimarina TaxID=295068 RepID=A0A1A8T455_9GAMM|nr:hypothetical protein [Marinomonas aquimarina]SBS26244.1 hypothetical protein MAQ5080_00465 [Marinomonas aquimarina]
MIVQASQLFEADGMTDQRYAYWLSGRQQVQKPLPEVQLIQQQLHVFEPVTIQEQVQAGVYITFNTTGSANKVANSTPIQVLPVYEAAQVDWEVSQEAQFNWTQLYISWSQLAAITGENPQQVQAFFKRRVSNDTGTPFSLTLTSALHHEFSLLMKRDSKQLAIVGKIYNIILQTLEHVQIQHHISQCDDCQKKLYASQNALEAEPFNSTDALAKQVGLTQTALELGFSVITGMSIGEYQIEVAFRRALAQPHTGQSLVNRLTADTGWTQQDIEKACLKRFGVMSHQLGSMQ